MPSPGRISESVTPEEIPLFTFLLAIEDFVWAIIRTFGFGVMIFQMDGFMRNSIQQAQEFLVRSEERTFGRPFMN